MGPKALHPRAMCREQRLEGKGCPLVQPVSQVQETFPPPSLGTTSLWWQGYTAGKKVSLGLAGSQETRALIPMGSWSTLLCTEQGFPPWTSAAGLNGLVQLSGAVLAAAASGPVVARLPVGSREAFLAPKLAKQGSCSHSVLTPPSVVPPPASKISIFILKGERS